MPAFAELDHAQRIVRQRHRAVLLHDLVEGAHDPAARPALAQKRLDHLARAADRVAGEHTSFALQLNAEEGEAGLLHLSLDEKAFGEAIGTPAWRDGDLGSWESRGT